MVRSLGVAIALFIGLAASPHTRADLDALLVRALGPVEGRAVVTTDDGRMHVLHTGDTVPGTRAVVRQVLSDRLVVEVPADGGQRADTVWIYRASDGRSRVKRMEHRAPKEERRDVTVTVSSDPSTEDSSR